MGFYFELEFISFPALTWILLSDLSSIFIIIVLFLNISDKWKYTLVLPLYIFIQNLILYSNELIQLKNTSTSFKYAAISVFIFLLLIIDYKYFRIFRGHVLNLKLTSLVLDSSFYELTKINKYLNQQKNEFKHESNSKLIHGLYYSKIYLDKLIKDSNRIRILDLIGSNTTRSICFGFLVILSIAPWLLHYLIPTGAVNYSLGFVEIGQHGYNDVRIFVWVISRKIMVIVPMVLWFWSYPSWWRYAVLSPLILYLFQFWEAIQNSYKTVEAYSNYKVFPFVLVSIILLLALSRIVRRQSCSLDTYDEIKEQIDALIQKIGEDRSGVGQYRNRFEQIRNKLVKDSDTDTKLAELLRLQQELQNKVMS